MTWRHLLHQTSEWSGSLFGIPDTVDHNRAVNRADVVGRKGEARPLHRPGTFWEYNDVRVNASASQCCTSGANPCRRCCGAR